MSEGRTFTKLHEAKMGHLAIREVGRYLRHRRIRTKVVGAPERPRLSVFRSNKHLYVQIVDDMAGKSVAGWSTRDKRLERIGHRGNVASAKELGAIVAADASSRGVKSVVFDRGGYRYHGRVKALAEALRAGGIQV